ncbi:MAG: S46 family peptidase [Planctomycetes bacterium]|nr:S46 family peptidase [Planctomycetota bacterium]
MIALARALVLAMPNSRRQPLLVLGLTLAVLGLVGVAGDAGGEEGFWRPDRPPLEQLAERHGFRPPVGYFERIGAATLRIADGGGCAVLVSGEGLVATSHHLVRERVDELGARGGLILEQGFLALRREREIPLPGLRLEQLVDTVDVSARLAEAVATRLADDREGDLFAVRARAIQDLIDTESTRSGLLCRVSDAEGPDGRTVLQRFRVHRDVRLVFLPDAAAATFGGDIDNFHFPRYWLDVAFLRLYEQDQPLVTPDHFDWAGPEDVVEPGDFIVLAGYPERIGRLMPPALVRRELETRHQAVIRLYDGMIAAYERFAGRGEAQRRQVLNELAAFGNARKSYAGQAEAMLRRGGIERMEASWAAAIGRVPGGDEALADEIEALSKRLVALFEAGEDERRQRLFSRLESRSLGQARELLRYARAVGQLDEGDPRLDEQRVALLADLNVDAELEAVVAAARLELARGELGQDDLFVAACDAVAGEAGIARAVLDSKIRDLAFRARLIAAGPAAIIAADDPMIRLAARLEPVWARLWGPESKARDTEIAMLADRIVFAASARRVPRYGPEPDGSLRVSFGEVRGFERGGSLVPPITNLFGLFARHRAMRGEAPFVLPRAFLEARDRLDLAGNVNFAFSADAGRGSSGGPVLDRQGRVLGLLFDINYENLGQYFVYGEEGRGVAVDAGFVLEALRKIYDAGALADELLGLSGPR